jgi:hypothetical protein
MMNDKEKFVKFYEDHLELLEEQKTSRQRINDDSADQLRYAASIMGKAARETLEDLISEDYAVYEAYRKGRC